MISHTEKPARLINLLHHPPFLGRFGELTRQFGRMALPSHLTPQRMQLWLICTAKLHPRRQASPLQMLRWMSGKRLQMVSHFEHFECEWPLMLSVLGLYEQQDDDQIDCNLRGKFVTDAEGRYSFYCLRPTPYPVRKLRLPLDFSLDRLLDANLCLLDSIRWSRRKATETDGSPRVPTRTYPSDCKYPIAPFTATPILMHSDRSNQRVTGL